MCGNNIPQHSIPLKEERLLVQKHVLAQGEKYEALLVSMPSPGRVTLDCRHGRERAVQTTSDSTPLPSQPEGHHDTFCSPSMANSARPHKRSTRAACSQALSHHTEAMIPSTRGQLCSTCCTEVSALGNYQTTSAKSLELPLTGYLLLNLLHNRKSVFDLFPVCESSVYCWCNGIVCGSVGALIGSVECFTLSMRWTNGFPYMRTFMLKCGSSSSLRQSAAAGPDARGVMSKAQQKRAKRRGVCAEKAKDGQQAKGGRRGPGLPNVRAFKEHHQKQDELRQKRLEEQQERQKLSRERELMKRRSLDSFQKDIQQRQRGFDRRELEMQSLEKHVNFENENSRKAYYREFKKVIEAADIVLEVLDARDPLGCRCPQVEQAVVQSGTNKKVVLVLNKIDLVPKDIVEKWIKYLRNEFPTVAFKASTQQQNKNLKRSRVPVTQATPELLGSSACVGAECLMKLLGNYCRSQDIRTTITVGVVGFPNVGKSSLINSLKRARACSVGATPGVTKCLQEIYLDKHIKLLDCPGIVMATSTSDAAMILRNCVKIEQLVDPVPAIEAILRRCSKKQIMEHYGVPDFHTALEFLALLARRQGKLRKGGLPDIDKAAKSVLMDWTGGRISYFTHPPETHTLPTHVSAEIVAEMGKEFDWDELEKGNRETLAECNSADMEMGFCTATLGVTRAGQEEPAELDLDEEEETDAQEISESMDADQDPEFGPMTVELKEMKTKSGGAVETQAPKPVDLREILDVDPLQQGQALLAASKKRKKQQKRADKLATKLSDSLTSAMNFAFLDS
ncbi:hypothetical protein AOLI_G00244770 [Acnodon oligacanthus]